MDGTGHSAQRQQAHGVQLVLERNYFYRDRYRLQLRLSAALTLLCLLLAGILLWVLRYPDEPVYFATSRDGRIVPLAPLEQPNQSNEAIMQWAADIVRRAYSFDFVHWRTQLAGLEPHFTEGGYHQFLAALKKSGNVDAVRSRRLVGSAIVSPPVITSEGVLNGTYTWELEVPLQVAYVSSEQTIQQSLLVTLTVRRSSTLDSEHGLAVDRFLTLVQ